MWMHTLNYTYDTYIYYYYKSSYTYTVSVIGTAVGTGLNAHKDFGALAAHYMSLETGYSFRSAPNKFYALAAHDALVGASAAIRMLASGLFRIANDVRLVVVIV